MQCISENEAQIWLGAHITDNAQALQALASWSIPGDAGRKMALAKLLCAHLNWRAGMLLWVTDWNIWPSAENMLLFDRLRAGSGETRSLHEAPAHWFTDREIDEGEAVLAIGLYFMWNMTLVAVEESFILQFDHHETLRFLGLESDAFAHLERVIVEFLA